MAEVSEKPKIIQITRKFENDETILIEFQGDIIHSIENQYNLMYLGKLIKQNEDNYIFNIGNHQIIGKKVKLKNPFLLCHKLNKQLNSNTIEILTIIEYKIIFNTRPIPMLEEIKKN
jgi:hypothetical protein